MKLSCYTPQQLHHGDIIWLGNVSLVVLLANPATESPTSVYTRCSDVSEQKTILRNVEQLQQQWIEADSNNGDNQQ